MYIIHGHSFIFPLFVGYTNTSRALNGYGYQLTGWVTRGAFLGVSTFFMLSGFLAVVSMSKGLASLTRRLGSTAARSVVSF